MMSEEAIANIAQVLGYNENGYHNFWDWISTEELAVFLGHYVLQRAVKSGFQRVLACGITMNL